MGWWRVEKGPTGDEKFARDLLPSLAIGRGNDTSELARPTFDSRPFSASPAYDDYVYDKRI